jgi:hypothetical protein
MRRCIASLILNNKNAEIVAKIGILYGLSKWFNANSYPTDIDYSLIDKLLVQVMIS